ncbi:MAG: RluA family pseudouridine synthase [Candidatus Rokuibacteriota bacterium]
MDSPVRRPDATLRERLRALYPGASGRRLKEWLAGGRVRVDGRVVRRGDVTVGSDPRVELGRPAIAVPAPLRLVHEDDDLVVIDKPAGLLTIATDRERARTAYHLLRGWSEARGEGRIFVVHRLDRETSGLLVFARSAVVKRALQAQFEARTAERVYVALVEGLVRAPDGELAGRLVEDTALRVRLSRAHPRGKVAISRYRVVERYRDATLLEVRLVTGRRGQIRAQLAALGHPIVGDRGYGSRRDPLRRVCLHATRLGFVHPDGRRLAFESPAPAGFRRPAGAPLRSPAARAGWRPGTS